MEKLTNQERLFLDRIAHHLVEAGGKVSPAAIETAARQVLDDDLRIFNMLNKNDALRTEVVTDLSVRAHKSMFGLRSAAWQLNPPRSIPVRCGFRQHQ